MGSQTGGIPTATTIDHVAFTVPDLDQAVAFFTTVLGCVVLRRAGPNPTDRYVHPAGHLHLALLRYDDHLKIELLAYTLPDGPAAPPAPPHQSDPGGTHLAFAVADLDAALAYLRAQPMVRVLEAGYRPDGRGYAFFATPWGMELQLISYPAAASGGAPDRV